MTVRFTLQLEPKPPPAAMATCPSCCADASHAQSYKNGDPSHDSGIQHIRQCIRCNYRWLVNAPCPESERWTTPDADGIVRDLERMVNVMVLGKP